MMTRTEAAALKVGDQFLNHNSIEFRNGVRNHFIAIFEVTEVDATGLKAEAVKVLHADHPSVMYQRMGACLDYHRQDWTKLATRVAPEPFPVIEVPSAPMLLWQQEHGSEYACPSCPDFLQDLSWHNDTCPSYGLWDDAEGVDIIRIWLEHPDLSKREYQEDGGRFIVALGDAGNYQELHRSDDWDAAVLAAKTYLTAHNLISE